MQGIPKCLLTLSVPYPLSSHHPRPGHHQASRLQVRSLDFWPVLQRLYSTDQRKSWQGYLKCRSTPVILLHETFPGFPSALECIQIPHHCKDGAASWYTLCSLLPVISSHTGLLSVPDFPQAHPASEPLHSLFALTSWEHCSLRVLHNWLLCVNWAPGPTSPPEKGLPQPPCLKRPRMVVPYRHPLWASSHVSLTKFILLIICYLFFICVSHPSPGWAPIGAWTCLS